MPFVALLGLLFVLLVAPQHHVAALAPFRIALLTAGVAIASFAAQCVFERRPLTVMTPEVRLTGFLVLWAIASIPLSYWPGGTASFLLDFYLKTVAVFWLLANVVDSVSRLRTVIWAMVLMSVPLSLTAVQNYLAGLFVAHGDGRIVGYGSSLAGNPNDLALMLNLLLPLAGALMVSTASAAARAALAAIIGLDLLGVVVTFSRAGFLTLAVLFALLLVRLFLRGRTELAAGMAVLALAGALLVPSRYLGRIATIVDIGSDTTGSAQERWRDTKAAARFMVKNPVVGAGAGMNVLALNEERGPTWKAVHNAYLEYGVELGFPGLVLFALLLRACLVSVRSARASAAGGPSGAGTRHLAEGLELSLIAFGVAAFFHPVGYQFYFYMLAGLSVAASRVATVAPSAMRPAVAGEAWWRPRS
jgi:O-antigen ligase